MVRALRGVLACGRCGAVDGGLDQGRCARCGTRTVPASVGDALGSYSRLLAGVHLAGRGARSASTAIDLASIALGAALLAAAIAVGGVQGGVIGALLFAACGATQVVARMARGRSLGHLLMGLRTVDDLAAASPGVSGLHGRSTLTADLRRGRDPLTSSVGELAVDRIRLQHPGRADDVGAGAAPMPPIDDAAGAAAVLLVLDSGESHRLERSVLVGRLPQADDDAAHDLLPWPDLSRTLGRTHALLEWSGTTLWVTDLGSPAGSSIVDHRGARQPLVSGMRGAAAPGWTVELGSRRITVRAEHGPNPTEGRG